MKAILRSVLVLSLLGASSTAAEGQVMRAGFSPELALDLELPAGHASAQEVGAVLLKTALDELVQDGALPLVYSPSLLGNTRVSCACEKVSPREALDLLLTGTGFWYVESNGQLLIHARTDRLSLGSLTSLQPHVRTPDVGVVGMTRPDLVTAPASAVIRQGTVSGRVVERTTLQPIAGAQVSIPATGRGTLSASDGRFILLNVPVGPAAIRVQMIGFGAMEQVVSVTEGGTATVDFELEREAVSLEAIVVTGTAGITRRRELGNAITQIDADVTETQPIENVSDLLRGRAAGVVVHGGQGLVGTATTIKIRGSSTMRLVNDGPLVYVDGVRVNNQMTGVGGASISRIDDIDPSTIENVEIIKGPAAATLYGTEAANGVINITTKRGAAGRTEWTFNTRQGANWLHDATGKVPVNWGVNPATGQIESLNLAELEAARGTPVFTTGHSQFYGFTVGGGTPALQYFVSGSSSRDEGALQENTARNYNARANINAVAGSTVTLQASTGLMLTRIQLPPGAVTNDLFRSSPRYLNDDRRGFRRAPPEAHYASSATNHEANRMTVGLTLNHTPTDWFTHRITYGMDVTDQANISLTPRLSPEVAQFFSQRFASGSKSVERESVVYNSFDYGATVTRPVSSALTSVTSTGLQVYNRSTKFTQASGEGFPAPGIETIAGAGIRQGSDDFLENSTVGVYLQEQVGWRDRLFVAAALRADDNSAFGEEFSLVYYPKISGSWVLSEESFWGLDFVNVFRLRAAYGESGQQPDAFDALRSYAPRADVDGSSTVRPDTPGNPGLGPERGKEIEAGFDAALFNDRVTLDFTFYDQKTADAIVARNVAPSSGFTEEQFVNIGEISNRGIEATLNGRVIETDAFAWDLGLRTATNRNRITELGLEGHLELGWTTRHQEGYPVGSFFAPRIVHAELDDDGRAINVLCDDGDGGTMSCDDPDSWIFAGHPDPNIEGSFTSAFTFANRLTVQALLDYKIGQSKYSTQMWWRYSSDRNTELNMYPERFDPKEVAAADLGNYGEFQFWVPRADFARLREVSIAYRLPAAWVARFGATGGQLSLAARNLGVWTNYLPYPYQDPEVLNPIGTFSGNREPQDTSGMPPLTSLELGVQVSF